MPQSRPQIPAAIQREVLIESGHRCAVCGDSCPLEQAHIIPWHKSKQHKAADLICLCASCHQRADHEGWGEKTLRIYKDRPWILRRAVDNQASRETVTIKVDLPFKEFFKRNQEIFRHALAGFLGIEPDDVQIIDSESGSTIVTVELPEAAAARLLDLMRKDENALGDAYRNLREFRQREKTSISEDSLNVWGLIKYAVKQSLVPAVVLVVLLAPAFALHLWASFLVEENAAASLVMTIQCVEFAVLFLGGSGFLLISVRRIWRRVKNIPLVKRMRLKK